MPKTALSLIFFLIFICMISLSSFSYSKASPLVLSLQDLTWLNCKPNEDINRILEILRQNHKISMHSTAYSGNSAYVAGDPTPAMSWVLSLDKNSRGELISMEYGRFKESKGGVKVQTSRGIEYGSNIERIYDAYGTNPETDHVRDPGMRYVELTYPFILEETGQNGKLIFVLHHKPGDSEQTATVIRMKWNIIEYQRSGQVLP